MAAAGGDERWCFVLLQCGKFMDALAKGGDGGFLVAFVFDDEWACEMELV